MTRIRAAFASIVLAAGLLFSCTQGDSPVDTPLGSGTAVLSLVPTFSSSALASASLPINLIRITTSTVPGNVVIDAQEFAVDPTDEQWTLDVEIPLDDDPSVQYLLSLELINNDGGVLTVEFAGQIGPLAVTAGSTPTVRQVAVVRGPLDNLAVVGLALAGPSSILEGQEFVVDASVQVDNAIAMPTVFWTSLDPTVASVDENGMGLGLAPGTAQIQAEAGSITAIHTFDVIGLPAAIEIAPESALLTELGEQVALTAQVVDSRGNDTGESVIWTVADGRVLANLGGGVFEAVGGGETTVTATGVESPDLSATATVTVDLAPVDLLIRPDQAVLNSIGDELALEVVGLDAQGVEIFGLDAVWSSSNPEAVSVDAEGVARAVGNGEAVISAEVDEGVSTSVPAGVAGRILTASATIVVDQLVDEIVVEPPEAAVTEIGATQQYTAQALDAGGTVIPGATFSWNSLDEAVGTVDTDGLATAVGAGETLIEASFQSTSGFGVFRVDLPVFRVEVSPSSATMITATELRFSAQAFDEVGNPIPGVEFDWDSSDQQVLVAFSGGLARANTPGDAVLSATTPDGVVGTADVTVVPGSGVAEALRFVNQPPSSVVQNQIISPPILVEAIDSRGVRDTSYEDEAIMSLQGGSGSAILGGDTFVNFVNGVATFDNLTVDLVGTGYELFVQPHFGSVTPALSSPFDVTAGPTPQPAFYETLGNTALRTGGFPDPGYPTDNYPANILDPTPSLTIETPGVFPTTLGGTIEINADGSFLYQPPLGIGGTDTYDYTVVGGQQATITIDIPLVIWWVDNTAGQGAGIGTSWDPFGELVQADGTQGGASAANEGIFVRTGDGLTTGQDAGVGLLAGQGLRGEGSALFDIGGNQILPAGSPPQIANTSGDAVSIQGDDTLLDGFDITLAFTNGIFASGVTNMTVFNVGVADAVTGIHLVGTTGALDFSAVDVSAGSIGLHLNGGGPVLDFTGSITGTASQQFLAENMTVSTDVTLTGTFQIDQGNGFRFVNYDGGFRQIGPTADFDPGIGVAIEITGGTGIIDFSGIRFDGTTTDAIRLVSTDVFATIDLDVLSTNAAGNSVHVNNLMANGSFTLTGAGIDDTGLGVFLGSVNGTVDLQAPIFVQDPLGSGIGLYVVGGSGNVSVDDVQVFADGGAPVSPGGFDPMWEAGSTMLGTGPTGIIVENYAGTATFDLVDISTGNYAGFEVFGNGSGTVRILNPSSSIRAQNDHAFFASNTALDVTLSTLNATSSAFAQGIDLNNVTGSMNISGGNITSMNGGVDISQSDMSFTFGGSISSGTSTQNTVVLGQNTGGTYTFSGPITDTGDGINLFNNDPSALTIFTGGLTLTPTAGQPGLVATGGGQLRITGTNTLVASNSVGINIDNVFINGAGVTFQSVDVTSSTTDGIVLNNTSSGPFAITGTGTPASGGTIAGSSNVGIRLTDAFNVQLDRIDVNNSGGEGINVTGGTGFSLSNSTLDSNGGTSQAGLLMSQMSGATTISNSTVTSSGSANAELQGVLGTFNATISNSTFNSSQSDHGLRVLSSSNSTGTVTVTGSTMSNNNFTGFAGTVLTGGDLTVQLDGTSAPNDFSGNGANGVFLFTTGNGQLDFDILSNTINNNGWGVFAQADLSSLGTGLLNGVIDGNTISGALNTVSPGHGIQFLTDGAAPARLQVSNNTIDNVLAGSGIQGSFAFFGAAVPSSNQVDFTAIGNNITIPISNSSGFGIDWGIGQNGDLCSNVSGNTVVMNGSSPFDVGGGHFSSSAVSNLEGLGASTASASTIEAFLTGINNGASATWAVNGFNDPEVCTVPN